MGHRPADSFRFDVQFPDDERGTVTDSDVFRGLSRVMEEHPWRPGRKITITPLWEEDAVN